MTVSQRSVSQQMRMLFSASELAELDKVRLSLGVGVSGVLVPVVVPSVENEDGEQKEEGHVLRRNVG
jgi:hypothetical protein